MRVLVCLPFAPWPVRVRSANLWPRIGREAEVHVVYLDAGLPHGHRPTPFANVASMTPIPFARWRAALRVATALPGERSLRVAWHDDESVRNAVGEAYERLRPDVVYAERLRSIPMIQGLPPERVVLDPTDSLPLFCEQVAGQAGAPLTRRIIDTIERRRLIELERRTYKKVTRVVACSTRDAQAMRGSAPGARVAIIRNGVDLETFRFAPVSNNGHPRVLMSGNFGYWPNGEAARWLLRQAPAVRERCGGELVFAGANPPAYLVRAARRGQVITSGFVPDLTEHIHSSTIVAAPIRFAAGSQNKILEAMACGRPVVATPPCAQGLESGGAEALAEAERDTFVHALSELATDEPRQRRLAERGRAYVEQHHDWEQIAPAMLDLLAQAAA